MLRPAVQPITGVLAATDLQHGSDAVLSAAASVARMTDARLHLAHVVTPAAVPRRVRARDPETLDDAVEEARRGIWIQANALVAEGVEIADPVVIRQRSIDRGIVDVARAASVDLIVMGSHARATTEQRLGSSADRVIRTAPVPCLVVRGEVRFPVHRAAVLTDFSRGARAGLLLAFSWLPALGLADPEGRLDVVHVAWPQSSAPPAGALSVVRRRLRQDVAVAQADVRQPPHAVSERIFFGWHPADVVAQEARAEGYQLLVVATQGHVAAYRSLIGSVALGLLHAAPCPVLVAPRVRRGP